MLRVETINRKRKLDLFAKMHGSVAWKKEENKSYFCGSFLQLTTLKPH